jgi:hypothetical protein
MLVSAGSGGSAGVFVVLDVEIDEVAAKPVLLVDWVMHRMVPVKQVVPYMEGLEVADEREINV